MEVDSIMSCKLLFGNAVSGESVGILMRSRLQSAARRMGFSDAARDDMALVAAEMISNQIKHAEGKGMLQIWQQPGPSLDIVAMDYGPGIRNIQAASQDGYSTTNTLGKGLGSITRLSDESAVYSIPRGAGRDQKWHGALFWARFNLHDRKHDPRNAAHACAALFTRALSDDRYNGDRVVFDLAGEQLRWMHFDGLGHGIDAERVTSHLENLLPQSANPAELFSVLDRRLASTRGAVAIVGEIDCKERTGRLLGVGDMSAQLVLDDQPQTLSFAPGILGKEHKTPQTSEFRFNKKMTLVTASDGIRRGWHPDHFPALFNQHPQVIAYVLGNTMGRVSDDQSLCVMQIH
mgnify:CR=1 FL=1